MNLRLALTLFVLAATGRSVTADYVTWNVVDLKGDPYSKTVVRFTPIRGWVADGTNTVVDVVRSATPSATGGGRTKVLGGVYKVTADGAPGSTLIAVPGDGGEYTLNQCAQFATNCPPFFFTNFFGRISERVKVSGEGVLIVTNNPGAWNEYLSLVVTASGGPTNGVTALQAANIAASIAADTNAALLTTIGVASNTVFTAIETPGRTNTVVDGSVGLERARTIIDKLRANTNIFKTLIFGDSIGSWDLGGPGTGIHQGLAALYGNAGCAGRSVDLFGGLEIQASSVGANPAEINNDGPTNWWGLWHRATNGTTVQWGTYGSSTGAVATHIGFYWRAQPQGGSFSFRISKDGAAFTEQAVLDGYAAVPEARYTNWTVTAGAYRVQAAISTDVTNVYIGPEIYDTRNNGVVGFYVNKGGLNLSQLGQVPAGVWDGVLTNFNPDLIIYNMAEVPDIGETAFEQHLTNTWAAWTRKATNAVVWVTGQAFRGNSDDYMHARENIILRRAALDNGWIYTDTRADAQSWERSIALGYMRGSTVSEDIVHFAPAGAKALGWAALRKAGLAQSARVSSGNSTVTVIATNNPSATITNAYVQTGKIGVGYGTNRYPTASIFMQTPEGEEKTLIASPGAGFFGVWFGSPASYPGWDNYTLIGAASTTNKTVATGSTYLNVKTGGELALRYGNASALWLKTNNQVHVNGSLSVGGVVNATNGFYGSGAGVTNIPLSGVTGLPAALAWLTNNTGGGGTGAVSSVNGLTGAVTLDAADVGAEPALGFSPQPASENGTNWSSVSTNVITELRQEIADTTLDFVPQYGTEGLTNLAGFSTNNPAFSGVIFVETNEYGAGIQTPGGEPFTFHASPIFPSSAIFSAMPQMRAGIWMGDDNSGINLLHETGSLSVGGGLVANGEIRATGGINATNLTGTIDVGRLPAPVTNAIWGGINLSNQTAIYMLSIATNTTLGAFGNLHASEFRTAQLWVQNTAGSNCTVALPAGTRCPDGTTLYCTNGGVRAISIGGLLNFTNAISRALP